MSAPLQGTRCQCLRLLSRTLGTSFSSPVTVLAALSLRQIFSSTMSPVLHLSCHRSPVSCMLLHGRVPLISLIATSMQLQLVHPLLGRVFRLPHRRLQSARGPPQAHRRLRGGPLLSLMAPLLLNSVEALQVGESLHFPKVLHFKGAANLLMVADSEGVLKLLYLLKVVMAIGVRLLRGVVLPGHPRRVPRAVRRLVQAVGRPALCRLPC